jgi:hypothetical protein
VSLIHFLLVYDHRAGALVGEPRQFSDATEAAQAYAELEREHRGERHLEIVLVGSDSIETIRLTHGNYFGGDRRSRRFAEELAAT